MLWVSPTNGVRAVNISVLVENTVAPDCPHLQGQHGLSLHIETHSGKHLLFDTGQNRLFAENAQKMGVDLNRVEYAVLSHHHYDHGGGLTTFFAHNNHAPIYCVEPDGRKPMVNIARLIKRPIGIKPSVFKLHAPRFHFIGPAARVADGIYLFSHLSHQHPMPAGNRLLYVDDQGALTPDDFAHELLMVIDEPDGLVVFTGCAHSGVMNMLDTVRTHFPARPIKGLIGGFHLMGLSKLNLWGESARAVATLAKALVNEQIPTIATGHCTGERGYQRLKNVLGRGLQPLATGKVIRL